MKQVCDINKCTGCSACSQVCPEKCIKMLADKRGHVISVVDEQSCINCGICAKICPINNSPTFFYPKECYAAWAKNEDIRISCSSGGISTLLSEYIVNSGGIVYGCASLKNLEFKHIRVDNIKDLELLKGSKYVYSNCEDSYKNIEKDLSNNKKVLFVGTPCQNAGILKYIGYNKNLYTINLICHGVPSQQMLKEYIRKKLKDEIKVKNISFRNGNNFILKCDGYNFSNTVIPNMYLTLFLKGINYRPSCYNCTYAQENRIGDITLGDFWGIGKKEPFKKNIENGCNVIIVNTDKGLQLLNSCRTEIYLYQREYDEAIAGNKQLQHHVYCGIYTKIFNKFYPLLSFNKAAFFSSFPMLLFEAIKNIIKKYASQKVYEQIFKFYKRVNNK